MKLEGDFLNNYNVLIDGELFNSPSRIILWADIDKQEVGYVLTKEHFPYWPTKEFGKITLEKKNE